MRRMMREVTSIVKRERKKIVLLFPIVATLCLVMLKLRFTDRYTEIIQEDCALENLQCVFYFVAALIALMIAKSFRANRTPFLAFLYALFSLALFFVSFEELSWGQRIFGFKGPAIIIEHNFQKDFTIHNLNMVQSHLHDAYILVGFLGAFTALLLPRRLKNKFPSVVRFVVPDRILAFYFFPAFAIYLYLQYVSKFLVNRFGFLSCQIDNGFVVWRDQEPAEFLLSLGFLFFVLITRYRQNFLKA